MFEIALIDIGGDGCVADIRTPVDTLAEAEIIAKAEIGSHLGTNDVQLNYEDDLMYEVISGGCAVGAVHITAV